MKFSVKSFVAGTIVGGLLFSGVALAASQFEKIELTVNPAQFFFNGEKVETDKPNKIYNGKEYVPASFNYRGTVYVPVRFLSESAGLNVEWDNQAKTVSLTSPKQNDSSDRKELKKGVDFQVLQTGQETLPAEIEKWVEENKLKEYKGTKVVNGSTYILIARGESSSTGYGIELEAVYEENNLVNVDAKYTDPKPDEAYATVITHPTLLVKMEQTSKEVQVNVTSSVSAPAEVSASAESK